MVEVKTLLGDMPKEILLQDGKSIPSGDVDNYVTIEPPESATTVGISTCLGIVIVGGRTVYLGHYVRPTKSARFREMEAWGQIFRA